MDSNNVIEVNKLNKGYCVGKEKIEVIKEVSLKVKKGSFTSIMGPSGCGKSTLLYLLGGLEKPDSGQIIINGYEVSKMKEKQLCEMRRKKIGFVFQFYNLVMNLSVEENILLPLLLDKKKAKDYKNDLTEMLDIIEMSNRRNHTPRELSGGQQQRVAIARALIFKPDLILADEPIGNLDSTSGENIMNLFKKINKEYGNTIIQVTHSDDAAQYGSNILSMKDGIFTSDIKL